MVMSGESVSLPNDDKSEESMSNVVPHPIDTLEGRLEEIEQTVSPAILKGLDRRASITPRKHGVPQNVAEQPAFKVSALLSNSLKMLSTPRKQVHKSPLKRPKTPKRTPEASSIQTASGCGPDARKATSPKKRGQVVLKLSKAEEVSTGVVDNHGMEQIDLGDFLRLTNIRFMDLTTTKRRPTGFPGALLKKTVGDDESDAGVQVQAGDPSFESCVVAASCTAPLLEMFQHVSINMFTGFFSQL
jgi:kinetochore protein Spc7/SPC105